MHKEYTKVRRFYAVVGFITIWGLVAAVMVYTVWATHLVDTALAASNHAR